MSFPRVLFLGSAALFLLIGLWAGVKKMISVSSKTERTHNPSVAKQKAVTISQPILREGGRVPSLDIVDQLFTTGPNKLPIVETMTYESSPPWLKGRPAWIADYASHYATSCHFIARSLNGKADYFTQKIFPGSQFNVFRKDKNFQFYLLADLSRCKMAFYYIDLDADERVLLKTYPIGVGKPSSTPSGNLTPVGRFRLGDKIGVYKPGMMGLFQNLQVEMISVFGTRWIPFGSLIGEPSHFAKGLGLHGAPWIFDPKDNRWKENRNVIGSCESDGCIRMAFEDMEELFSIVITKPTIIEIVHRFEEAELPGREVSN